MEVMALKPGEYVEMQRLRRSSSHEQPLTWSGRHDFLTGCSARVRLLLYRYSSSFPDSFCQLLFLRSRSSGHFTFEVLIYHHLCVHIAKSLPARHL
jgi:hypothetical protein